MSSAKKQIVILGLGKFGMNIARTLSDFECEVLAIDDNTELVDAVANYVTRAVKANTTDIDVLKELGVAEFDIAIVGIGDNLESSIMTSLVLRELQVPHIIAKARDENHARLLNMIGVNRVVQPEREEGIRIAKGIMHKNIIERLEFSKDYSIVEMIAPKAWIGEKLKDLDIRPKYNINIVCVENEESDLKVFPNADYEIQVGDSLMIIAPNKELEANGFIGRLMSK